MFLPDTTVHAAFLLSCGCFMSVATLCQASSGLCLSLDKPTLFSHCALHNRGSMAKARSSHFFGGGPGVQDLARNLPAGVGRAEMSLGTWSKCDFVEMFSKDMFAGQCSVSKRSYPFSVTGGKMLRCFVRVLFFL